MLQDLSLLEDNISKRIQENLGRFYGDCKLPDSFKSSCSAIESSPVFYFDYGFLVITDNLNKVYLPNQLWYFAALCTELYTELVNYRNLVYSLVITDKEVQDCKTDTALTLRCVQRKPLSPDDNSLIIKFLNEYKWWRGGKTIDRENDFFVSPILSTCILLNNSQDYVAIMTKYLATKPLLVKLLLDYLRSLPFNYSKEIVISSTNIVSFMGECIKVFLSEDSTLGQFDSNIVKNKKTAGFSKCPFAKLKTVQDAVTDPARMDDCDKSIIWSMGGCAYYFLKEQTNLTLEIFSKVVNKQLRGQYYIELDKGNYVLYKYSYLSGQPDVFSSEGPIQQIYYGAPGTGKSNEIKKLTGEQEGEPRLFGKDFVFRVTFHPDSDYSSFVGAYKPYWDKTLEKIIYGFRPQAFMKAYVSAWKNPEIPVALVVEEINRGNCSQIFGDVFQLLDREKNGLSKYPIDCDIEMQDYLADEFASIRSSYPSKKQVEIVDYYSNHYDDAFSKIINGEIMSLPQNLSILATMNTSDQSLFPMDSAFKRRWEWHYMPIKDGKKGWKIMVDTKYEYVDWNEFLSRINKEISELTSSEDKQLGYYFCTPDLKRADSDDKETIISASRFVNKVIFYLWNDVFKDYAFESDCCKSKDDRALSFADFYKGEEINSETLIQFFKNLSKREGEEQSLLKEKLTTAPAEEENGQETDSSPENDGNEPSAEPAENTSSPIEPELFDNPVEEDEPSQNP